MGNGHGGVARASASYPRRTTLQPLLSLPHILGEFSEPLTAHPSPVGEVQGQCHLSHTRASIVTGRFCSCIQEPGGKALASKRTLCPVPGQSVVQSCALCTGQTSSLPQRLTYLAIIARSPLRASTRTMALSRSSAISTWPVLSTAMPTGRSEEHT